MAGWTELLAAVSARYGSTRRLERSRILSEFAAVTGSHRKHLIRLLSGWGGREEDEPREGAVGRVGCRRRRYGPEVAMFWSSSRRLLTGFARSGCSR